MSIRISVYVDGTCHAGSPYSGARRVVDLPGWIQERLAVLALAHPPGVGQMGGVKELGISYSPMYSDGCMNYWVYEEGENATLET
jgi:hypothetical protein